MRKQKKKKNLDFQVFNRASAFLLIKILKLACSSLIHECHEFTQDNIQANLDENSLNFFLVAACAK